MENIKDLDEKFPYAFKMHPSCELIGRDDEIEMLREILAKKRMRNAILVGEAGVGKTELVRAVAEKAKSKFDFYEISVAGSVAGSRYVGDFEKRMVDFFARVSSQQKRTGRKTVLFIDEIHTIVGAGAASMNGGESKELDFANIIKPYISSGEFCIWGATTPREYERSIRPDKALTRRMSPVFIEPLGEAACVDILRRFCGSSVSEQSIREIYRKSSSIKWSAQPDCCIEVADRCMARALCQNRTVDSALIDEICSYMIDKIGIIGLTYNCL